MMAAFTGKFVVVNLQVSVLLKSQHLLGPVKLLVLFLIRTKPKPLRKSVQFLFYSTPLLLLV